MAKARAQSGNSGIAAKKHMNGNAGKPVKGSGKPARKPRSFLQRCKRFVFGLIAWVLLVVALLGTLSRALPEELQSLPYVPVVAAFTPWFALLGLVSLVLALVSRRWFAALLALMCVGLQGWWQYPYFVPQNHLNDTAITAVSGRRANIDDGYARVMTANVYQGRADVKAIIAAVRDQRVEVLALQETTRSFINDLKSQGIHDYLPYSQVSSSDGKYGNALFSAVALDAPSDDDVDSAASFMPGGTVSFAEGKTQVRFVSVHTTSPKPGCWDQWRTSLDEVARMKSREDVKYVLMGDFNSTTDHTPLRNILGSRFHDAAQSAGHGLVFTWPSDMAGVPKFAGIDHIILDQGLVAGQVSTVSIPGSDHDALLATIMVQ